MACSGFSAAPSMLFVDEALLLKPKAIVLSYYFGNDTLEVY